jgi:hypothetical protein
VYKTREEYPTGSEDSTVQHTPKEALNPLYTEVEEVASIHDRLISELDGLSGRLGAIAAKYRV